MAGNSSEEDFLAASIPRLDVSKNIHNGEDATSSSDEDFLGAMSAIAAPMICQVSAPPEGSQSSGSADVADHALASSDHGMCGGVLGTIGVKN